MPIYQTTFEINASADRVWEILTELDRYPEWNPQIPAASGTVEAGAKIDLRLKFPGRPAMNVSAIVERAEPNLLFTWRGHLVAPWFFVGYRKFEIQAIDGNHVRMTHVEDIRGLFAPVFVLLMGRPVESSHRSLNEAIRTRAEKT
ncbi:MAG: SRPBCC domain-containing protein [Actinomycetota bacterium]